MLLSCKVITHRSEVAAEGIARFTPAKAGFVTVALTGSYLLQLTLDTLHSAVWTFLTHLAMRPITVQPGDT